MAITIHLVRHAQGFHNLTEINQQIPDPYLTPLGKEQCATLCSRFMHHDRITHLVASPMRRTLQTCHLSFRPAVESGIKVVAQPLVQEVSMLPCDTGSEPEVLQAEYGAWGDFGLVEKGWNDKTSPGSRWAPAVEALEERARAARVWLRELGRKAVADGVADHADVVVTTHGGFLHFLTQDWDGMDFARGTGWDNTECRSYEFVEPEGDDPEAMIRETESSWQARRGSAIPLTDTEQQQLKSVIVSKYNEHFDIINGTTAK
ncbi:hypothetical protein VSDG_08805 [Cytospora chrysosperma]|uniref:Phosphoglycerate mutase family protein n=1 Tax=Cytospora chrysosperma TaxID=252740 RepID=A0A423VGR9_CYTCH|nr:hypothetical protein VSDG_08805 [Valsa sordida]